MNKINYESIYNVLHKYSRQNETEAIKNLVNYLKSDSILISNASQQAYEISKYIRKQTNNKFKLDNLVNVYPIASDTGQSIMTLAEALIRIPDKETQNTLIVEKIKNVKKWNTILSNGFFIFIFSWIIQLSKIVIPKDVKTTNKIKKFILKISNSFSKKIIKYIAYQFVTSETIDDALKVSHPLVKKGYSFSYDMLGEAARTESDALKYFELYKQSIIQSGEFSKKLDNPQSMSVSIKLSSLHPRYELSSFQVTKNLLYKRLLELCILAKKYNIPLFIDAEETERIGLSVELLHDLIANNELKNWNMLGFVVQSYQKGTFYIIDEIANICKKYNKKIYIRLVKGAYWDSEIKLDQINGVDNFSLFTRKEHTDISYFACAKKIITCYSDVLYPCFATHNALTVAYIMNLVKDNNFEFQCLHGMGNNLYDPLLKKYKIRKYAPVGEFSHLLPYLVRRLLENGANNSFVNQIANKNVDLRETVKNPILIAKSHGYSMHPLIKLPKDIFIIDNRINSKGLNMLDKILLEKLVKEVEERKNISYEIFPIINGENILTNSSLNIINPANKNDLIGKLYQSDKDALKKALSCANNYFNTWNNTNVEERANILNKIANKFEENTSLLVSLLVREAGKTLKDSILDIREGVDFLRYYAEKSKELFSSELNLPGPVGEKNTMILEGKGVFLCISPWNFPFAIFIGQIAAALASGNTVLAKPAESTSAIGYLSIKLMLDAGLPKETIQFIPGSGKLVGETLLTDPLLSGVVFTGSEATAKSINQSLATRSNIIPLIAETGGQNAMIADSTALVEKITKDVIASAFQSSGQRCSALRILYIQDDIADETINMIKGAMQEIKIGNPINITTDIGPIINQSSLDNLNNHIKYLKDKAKHIYTVPLDDSLNGYFFAPTAYEINSIKDIPNEVFGPVLHIIRFNENNINNLVNEVNSSGYGLTFSIHSMLQERIDYFAKNINCGNIYVNRNQIGAVVGSQPFGGRNKSGTGPKAGGPLYLHKFANEKTISVDITAIGGNATLMSKL